MNSLFLWKVGILFTLLSVSSVQSRITSADLLLAEFGTYSATDIICFYKQILKRAGSPKSFVFNNPSGTNIKYIKVEQMQQRYGGIVAEITNGAIGTPTVTLQVSAAQDRSSFSADVRIEMMCAPPAAAGK